MENPRHWRLNEQRYALVGSVCPFCGAKLFPPRQVCPHCGNGGQVEQTTTSLEERADRGEGVKKNAFGVGALIFIETKVGLKLLLFKQTEDNTSDNGERDKLERVAGQGFFEIPKGFNTVTGKVDNVDADNYPELVEGNVPDELRKKFVATVIEETRQEAGIELSEEQIHFFTQSSTAVEQFRKGDFYYFTVFPFTVVINEADLENVDREYELFDADNENKLLSVEMRAATQAVMEFLSVAVLFLSTANQEEMAELAAISEVNSES